jgi:hypothetical protein
VHIDQRGSTERLERYQPQAELLDQSDDGLVDAGDADRSSITVKPLAQRTADGADSPPRTGSRFEHQDSPARLPEKIGGPKASETGTHDHDEAGWIVRRVAGERVHGRSGPKRRQTEESPAIEAMGAMSSYWGHCASALTLMMG